MPGPLDGLKVLDFSTLLPGPFATMMLGDLGAEVTRVVAPGRGGVRPDGPQGRPNSMDMTLNRNKRSIAVNMKSEASREVIRRLVERADVLVEQFRPGVMDRLGWGYDAARAVNPKIIYCALTGYGQTGPMRDRAGHDLNYLALSGLMSYAGRKDTGPSPFSAQVADVCAGSYNLVVGVLAALYHRGRTGEGQFVDVSMHDGSIALNAISGAEFLKSGYMPGRETELLNGGTLYDCYRTKDGEYLSAGGLEPKFLADFLKGLGLSHLARENDSMFLMADKEKAKQAVAERIATKTLAEWVAVFSKLDACVEPVVNLKGMVEHGQTKDRQMIVEVDDGYGGRVRQIAHPIKFSATPPSYQVAGRQGGADTDAILREIGFPEGEIESLRNAGAFGG